jgi:predicted ArsR family transcriptional regulator
MPIEELLLRLETTSFLALAKELGVSDNAIRKHIKNHTEFTKHNGDKNECR